LHKVLQGNSLHPVTKFRDTWPWTLTVMEAEQMIDDIDK
jgi:hypothetical protein